MTVFTAFGRIWISCQRFASSEIPLHYPVWLAPDEASTMGTAVMRMHGILEMCLGRCVSHDYNFRHYPVSAQLLLVIITMRRLNRICV